MNKDSSPGPTQSSLPKTKGRKWLRGIGEVAAILAALLLLFMANFHIFTTQDGGVILLRKSRVSLADTVVPLEKIIHTPTKEAMERWPVAYETLLNNGMIVPIPHMTSEQARQTAVGLMAAKKAAHKAKTSRKEAAKPAQSNPEVSHGKA